MPPKPGIITSYPQTCHVHFFLLLEQVSKMNEAPNLKNTTEIDLIARVYALETIVNRLRVLVDGVGRPPTERETEDGPILGPINPGDLRIFSPGNLDTRLDYIHERVSQMPLTHLERQHFTRCTTYSLTLM